jgi:DNA polymerase-1
MYSARRQLEFSVEYRRRGQDYVRAAAAGGFHTRSNRMSMGKSFYIIDGHWQIFRAYYAPFQLLTAPGGEPAKATYVFNSMLLKLIHQRRPDYLAVAFDSGREHLARTKLYPEYKAQRAAAPEDLRPQINRVLEIVRAMGVPLLQVVGAEGDDIMATLARKLTGQDVRVVLVSRDKDLDQLIAPNVVLYDPMKEEEIDAEKLFAAKGYRPGQALDVQSLCGDDSDNIPGIPGVGLKTAAKLVAQYGSAEAVLAHAAELTPKLAENVRAHGDAVALARQLIALNDQVPISTDLAAYEFHGINVAAVKPLYEMLGFRRLLEQLDKVGGPVGAAASQPHPLPGRGRPAGPGEGGQGIGSLFEAEGEPRPSRERGEEAAIPRNQDTAANAAAVAPISGDAPVPAQPGAAVLHAPTVAGHFDYRLVDTPELLDELVAALAGVTRLAVDTETTSLVRMQADLVGISLAWAGGKAFYLPVMAPLGARTLDRDLVRAKLAGVLADERIQKVGHNLKFDMIILANFGLPVRGPLFDTILAAYVLDASRGSYRLDALAADYLNHRGIPIEDLIGRGKHQRVMSTVPIEMICPYACEDADLTFRLAGLLEEKLHGQGLFDLFAGMEMRLLPILTEMEMTGILVDRAVLRKQQVELSKMADALRDRIIAEAACGQFNVDSPRQLADVLFEHLKLPAGKRTQTGQSTDSSVLEELAGLHAVPALVLEYRQITKLLGTYLTGLAECINDRTGRVHTCLHQTTTVTGRLSSSDPNLQNIPIRTDLGKQIRAAFIAGAGNRLISADYSQVELRILAHMCQDPTLLAAFHDDQDIHRIVAAEVFGVKAEEVTPEQRAKAKTVNFGIIYGQTAFGLAATLRIGRQEAQQFITSYRARFPRIDEFLQACVAQARRQGYVETLAGRRRRIDGIDSPNPQRRALGERMAINSVVQGSAADLIKIAMINVHDRLTAQHSPAKMLLQIHDELLFETPRDAVAADTQTIVAEMTAAMTLAVPLKVDVGTGVNWRDAK